MATTEKNEGHFTGEGDCLIHTSKTGTCQRMAKKGGCDYGKNCAPEAKELVKWETTASPWQNADGENEWEAHHIVCVEAVIRYHVAYASVETEIDAVYRKTEWCINQKPNLIPLPLKMVYERYEPSRTLNRPCHNWDHNVAGGYRDEVAETLGLRIWSKIKELGEAACRMERDGVATELEHISADFRGKLRDRGKRGVGTIAADEAEREDVPNWWYAFSMAQDCVAEMRDAKAYGKPESFSEKDRLEARKRMKEALALEEKNLAAAKK